ncbi:TniQ family protein [Streptomyces sp. NPDC045470]|uniref:TniQ family protein n=1 Tax=Streptomyces sp. NPDC045470 TaxID=3155469 RepID=UPI0033E4AE95
MRPLPRSLAPLPDELLSGYLLRLSCHLGTSPDEIAARTGLAPGFPDRRRPNRLPLGTLYHLDEERLHAFAVASRLSVEEAASLLLAPLGRRYGPLHPDFSPRRDPARIMSDNPWILTRSTRCCRTCLTGDGSEIQNLLGGAWKRSWRLPVTFACTEHQRLLDHQCHACDQPIHVANTHTAIPRLHDATLHPLQCRSIPSGRDRTAACGADFTTATAPTDIPDTPTLEVLLRRQEHLNMLLDDNGPERALSAGTLVPIARYFADLRATAGLLFLTWPLVREHTATPQLAAALDRSYKRRRTLAVPLMNAASKRHSSRPYTVPPDDAFTTGAALDTAARLLDAPDPAEARTRMAPLFARLHRTNPGLSSYVRRPAWISASLRAAADDH